MAAAVILTALLVLAVLALLAVVPAVIAQQNDAPDHVLAWWLYGFLLWPVAMVHAVWREPIDRWHEQVQRERAPAHPEG